MLSSLAVSIESLIVIWQKLTKEVRRSALESQGAVTIDWIKSAVKVDVLKAPLKNDDVCSPVHHLWPKLK